VFLGFSFLYLFIAITVLALDFYIEQACALVVFYTCFYFLLYFVYDYII